jgi:hypothetical protein
MHYSSSNATFSQQPSLSAPFEDKEMPWNKKKGQQKTCCFFSGSESFMQ